MVVRDFVMATRKITSIAENSENPFDLPPLYVLTKGKFRRSTQVFKVVKC